VRFLKVTGGECKTLTDHVDFFKEYNLYDEKTVLTEELLDALLSSLDPTQGLQSK
jgi:peptide methionine sulfoxide reductase MsrA